jgi:hypothetical protein
MQEAGHHEEAALTVVATRKAVNLVLLAALGLRRRPQWWTFQTEALPPVTVIPLTGGLYELYARKLCIRECFIISKARGNTSEDTRFSFSSQLSGAAYAFGKLEDLHGFPCDVYDVYDRDNYENHFCVHKVILETAHGGRLAMESDKTHAAVERSLSPPPDLHFLSVFSCFVSAQRADELKIAMKRLLCWHAGLDVRPGSEGSEHECPTDFRIDYLHLNDDVPGEFELRVDVRTTNLWAALILADKAWTGLRIRQSVEVEHVVVDPREVHIHTFELEAAELRSTLEWLDGNEYKGKDVPWPTTSVVRIDRRLATITDVVTVRRLAPEAADALRADVVRTAHATRIIQRAARDYLYNPERGVAVKRARVRFDRMACKTRDGV